MTRVNLVNAQMRPAPSYREPAGRSIVSPLPGGLLWLLVALLTALTITSPLRAQSLRDLIQQSRPTVEPSEILDQARRQGLRGPDVAQPPESVLGGVAPLPRPRFFGFTDDELTRIESYCADPARNPEAPFRQRFSGLERDYCRRAETTLLQFGYDMFDAPFVPSALGSGAIPEDYVLGIGEQLIITFHGQESGTHVVFVDREGRVVIEKMPPIAAAGRSFGEFRRELEARTRTAFLGTEVFVSVGAVRMVSVAVVGEVIRPGLHRLTGLSSVLDALSLAGGVKKTGSLRRIQVQRGDRLLWFDLYELLISGAVSSDLALFDGDRIFVPPIGATAAIAGQVKRAGIYELAEGTSATTIARLLDFAGGGLRPRGLTFYQVSFADDGRELVTQRQDPGARVADGDIVVVQPLENVQQGSVELVGHVRVAGRRSLSSAASASRLLDGTDNLLPNPYLAFAALETTDAATQARRLVPVNLERVIAGREDLTLRADDRLFVFGLDDIRYLSSAEVQDVLLGRPLEGLAVAPGARSPAVQERVEAALGDSPPLSGPQPAPAPAPALAARAACRGLRVLAQVVSSGQSTRFADAVLARGSESPFEFRDRIECPPVFDQHPDLLPFLLEHAAAVYGEVRRPGVYPVTPETTLASLIAAGGGLTILADPGRVEVAGSAEGSAGAPSRVDLAASPPERTPVGPGYVVRFNAAGTVSLAGDVRAPGRRPLAAAPTVQELLGTRDNLRDTAYFPFAALETTDPATRARRLFALNLERILRGEENYSLRDKDRLIVLSTDDVRYLSSKDVQDVILGRPVPGLVVAESGLVTVQREAAREVTGAQAVSPAGVAGAPPTTEGPGPATGAPPLGATPPSPLAELRRRPSQPDGLPTVCAGLQSLAAIISGSQTERFSRAIQARLTEAEVEFNLRRECPKIFDDAPDLLPFALEHVVAVKGEVRRPGAYPVAGATPVLSVIAVAGGLSREADLLTVEISRLPKGEAGAQVTLRRESVNLAVQDSAATPVNPGDVVRFNPIFTDRDTGPVLLAGEFVRPGLYDIRRGERLSEIIARAGGVTNQAYTFGAVFTRERVRKAEEEGFRRAARDISSTLTVLASRSNTDPRQLVALQQLAQNLESAEAVGRVVIEADPQVLAARPEFDTVLEPGDRVFIPKRPNFVSVSGDVLSPSTLQFAPGRSAAEYISLAGGTQRTADDDRIFVVLPNGQAQRLATGLWNFSPAAIPPGSTIVVPRDPAPFDLFGLIQDVTPIVSQLAVTAASLAVINRN